MKDKDQQLIYEAYLSEDKGPVDLDIPTLLRKDIDAFVKALKNNGYVDDEDWNPEGSVHLIGPALIKDGPPIDEPGYKRPDIHVIMQYAREQIPNINRPPEPREEDYPPDSHGEDSHFMAMIKWQTQTPSKMPATVINMFVLVNNLDEPKLTGLHDELEIRERIDNPSEGQDQLIDILADILEWTKIMDAGPYKTDVKPVTDELDPWWKATGADEPEK